MIQDSKVKYFPLKTIAAETPYSADYLRLRILQKKLKGLKIGRDWYTTRQWLEEYLERHSEKRIAAGDEQAAVREPDYNHKVRQTIKTSRRNFPKKLFLAPLAVSLLFIAASFAAASPHSWPERIAKAIDRAGTFLLETPVLSRAGEFASAADGAIAASSSAVSRFAALVSSTPSDMARSASALVSSAPANTASPVSFVSLIDSAKNLFSSLVAKIRLPSSIARLLNLEPPRQVQNKTDNAPLPPPAPVAVSPAPFPLDPASPLPALPPRPTTETVRVREVIERKEIITPADTALFQQKLDELNSGLRSQVNKLVSDVAGLYEGPEIKTSLYRTVAPSQKIDRLSGVIFSGSNSFNLSDDDIPDSVTANNYLPLSGGTLTGTILGTSAIFANGIAVATGTPGTALAITGAGVFTDRLTASVFSATSTTATSTFSGGIIAATGAGSLGVGTSSPYETLSVAGDALFGGNATSTFEGNLRVLNSFQIGKGSLVFNQNEINSSGSLGLAASGANAITLSTNGAERLYVDGSGRVGVGCGPSTCAFDSTNWLFTKTFASGSGDFDGVSFDLTASAATPGNLNPLYLPGTYSNSGILGGFTGGQTYFTSSGGGTVTNARGFVSELRNASAGTFTNVYGFESKAYNTANGTISNLYNFYVTPQAGGTITNAYGLYVPALTGSTTYAIYVTSDTSRFAITSHAGVITTDPVTNSLTLQAQNQVTAIVNNSSSPSDTATLRFQGNGATQGQVGATAGASGFVFLANGDSDDLFTGRRSDDHVILGKRAGGSMVGIGNFNSDPPDALLHLQQAGTTNYLLRLQNTSAPRAYRMQIDASGTFLINDATPNADRFALTSAGNVGIGTTSPGALLSVKGAGLFGEELKALGPITAQTFTATSSSIASTFPIASTTSFSISNLLDVDGTGTSTFDGSIATNLLGITGSGTSTIANHFQIGGNLRILGTLDLKGGCTGCGGGASGSDRQVQFNSSGAFSASDQLVFSASNFLGIGTGTPGTALAVTGAGVFTGRLTASVFTATSTAATSTFSGGIIAATGAGNLGVGTSSPYETLSVAGDALFGGNATSTFEGNLRVLNSFQIGKGSLVFNQNEINSSGSLGLAASGANAITLGTNGAERMRIDSAGNLGIGTTSPGGLLSVHGQALIVGTTTIVGGLLTPSISATSSLGVYTGGAAAPRVVVDASGNVGIGTTNPSELLYLRKTTAALAVITNDTFTLQAGADSNVGAHFGKRGGNGASFAGAGDFIPITIDSAGNTGFPDNNSALGRSTIRWGELWVNGLSVTGGNVGIGTTSPGGLLSVHGQALIVGTTTIVGGLLTPSISATSSLGVYTGGGAAPRVVVDATGNVGIGTASPGAQLDLSTDSARKLTTTTWTTGSDIRIKTNVQSISDALGIISRVRPVKFHYTSDFLAAHPSVKDTDYYNFIAQEYQQVFPNSVSTSTDGILYLNSSNMIPYAIAGIKEAVFAFEAASSTDNLEMGDIVAPDATAIGNVKKSHSGDTAVLGVVSSPRLSVAASGRVPVKVSTEAGPIAIGDRIAVSSLAGVGMKATTSGMTVGIALEGFDEYSEGEWVDVDAATNQKAAETATFGGSSDNPSSPKLTLDCSIANRQDMSSSTVDNSGGAGAAGNCTPETRVSISDSDYPSPSTDSSYQTETGKVKTGKILVFVNLGYSHLDLKSSEVEPFAGGSTSQNIWSVDQTTGKITAGFSGGLDLNGNDISNVRSILSANGAWGIDENGNLAAKTVIAETITARSQFCVGNTCFGEEQIRTLLQNAGLLPAASAPAPASDAPARESAASSESESAQPESSGAQTEFIPEPTLTSETPPADSPPAETEPAAP